MKIPSGLFAALLLGLLFVLPQGAAAQQSWSDVIDTATKEIIYRYYQGDAYTQKQRDQEHSGKKNKGKKNKDGLPPGLAKRETLPPGLQKQLAENGTLPPGLAKRDLPPDLLEHIKVPKGEEFIIVDDNVVLIEKATGVILDVLEGVLRN